MSFTTNMPNYPRRKVVDQFMRGLTIAFTGLAIVALVLIIGYVLVRGGSALNAEFFTDTYKPPVPVDFGGGSDFGGLDFSNLDVSGGTAITDTAGLDTQPALPPETSEADLSEVEARGGVLHGIVGTLMITIIALLISLPIGLLAGIFLSEVRDNPLSTFVRFCTDVLSGAPSIVIGVVGYILIVRTFKTYSALAGSVALTFLMVPTITRTTEEMLRLIPSTTREAAMALGAPSWYSTFTVIIPTALSGIVTGTLLAFARGAGETAPLLLTVLGDTNLSFNLLAPMAALPLLSYKYIESPFPSENVLAWGTAFVLMMLVLIVNVSLRWVTRGRQ